MACEYLCNRVHVSSSVYFGNYTRFRDNVLLIVLHDMSSDELLLFFKQKYCLLFTKEQVGQDLLSLELSLRSKPLLGTVKFFYSWKNATLPELLGRLTPYRWVNPQAYNARSALQSYIPSSILKCRYYATSTAEILFNLEAFLNQLLHMGFPKPWMKLLYREINFQKGIG